MAHGNSAVVQEADKRGHYGKHAKLLDNLIYSVSNASFKGPWVDISTLKSATVQVIGTGLTGTVNIEGTNVDNPDDTSAAVALCTAPTATGISVLTNMPVRYVRARMSGFSAGSLTVLLHGVA